MELQYIKYPKNNNIYFDNAATSFPKPDTVIKAVLDYMTKIGANPGRAGHRLSMEAGEIVFKARKNISRFFGAKNPMNVIFGFNATDSLNLAIKGVLSEGDHVITSSMEHNSVIRPLKRLEQDGIIFLTILKGDEQGILSVEEIDYLINDYTKAVVINHMSNVTGVVQPIKAIGKYCKGKSIIFIVDCAQSAGIIPINMETENIDILAFAGHKGLYGPTGTGGMIISENFDHRRIKPLKEGGTGSLSDKIFQPDFLPDKFESGTLNVAGIAGLSEGVEYISSINNGANSILAHKKELQEYFVSTAEKEIEGFILYSPKDAPGVVSFKLGGISVSEITNRLSEEFGIMSRQGLHCSPLAHQRIGTFPEGTVRFGFSIFNTIEEIDIAINALKLIQKDNKSERQ